MGLDSIEILVKVEKTFGIEIPNLEAEKIITVGDFYEAVWKYVGEKESARCKSQALYYRLRRSFDAPFALDAVPDEIFSRRDRRMVYARFAEASGLRLPQMVLNNAGSMILNSFGWITILGGTIYAWIMGNWFWVIPVMGIVLTMQLSKLLEPMRTVIKEATVREFVHKALHLNYDINTGVNRKEMERVIDDILVEMAGVEPNEITPHAKLGDDLGIS